MTSKYPIKTIAAILAIKMVEFLFLGVVIGLWYC